MLELAEVRELLDGRRTARNEPITAESLQTALQALLFHQCLYEDTPFAGESYRVVVAQDRFFERYFGAMGYRLVIDPRARMVALVPGGATYGWQQSRLRKDETIVMLALRYALEEGLKEGAIDEDGRVETTSDELYDRVKLLAGTEPPDQARLMSILKMLRRKGAVRIGEHDGTERVTPLTILPGIRVLVPDVFVEGVILWLESQSNAPKADGDVIAKVSAYVAGIGRDTIRSADAAETAGAEEADDASS